MPREIMKHTNGFRLKRNQHATSSCSKLMHDDDPGGAPRPSDDDRGSTDPTHDRPAGVTPPSARSGGSVAPPLGAGSVRPRPAEGAASRIAARSPGRSRRM